MHFSHEQLQVAAQLFDRVVEGAFFPVLPFQPGIQIACGQARDALGHKAL
jgi:hypothetical protein